jgi:hypothetical protein
MAGAPATQAMPTSNFGGIAPESIVILFRVLFKLTVSQLLKILPDSHQLGARKLQSTQPIKN